MSWHQHPELPESAFEPDPECIDCGEQVHADDLPYCDACRDHHRELATIPDSPVPYGSGRVPEPRFERVTDTA